VKKRQCLLFLQTILLIFRVLCLLLGILASVATTIHCSLRQSSTNYYLLDDKTNISAAVSATDDDMSWMISVKRVG